LAGFRVYSITLKKSMTEGDPRALVTEEFGSKGKIRGAEGGLSGRSCSVGRRKRPRLPGQRKDGIKGEGPGGALRRRVENTN